MKGYKQSVTSVIILTGFYFRVWLYSVSGITLMRWLNNNPKEPFVSADFWESLYPVSKFLIVILLLILAGDLIRFYRNIRRHPVITESWYRFCLPVAALTGSIIIILLTVSY